MSFPTISGSKPKKPPVPDPFADVDLTTTSKHNPFSSSISNPFAMDNDHGHGAAKVSRYILINSYHLHPISGLLHDDKRDVVVGQSFQLIGVKAEDI